MVKITLHGKLAEIAGQSHWYLEVQTATEALRAVDANCGGRVRQYLVANLQAEYRVLLNDADFKAVGDIANPHRPLMSVDFVPVLQGAGSGWWQVIVGVVLAAVTWYAGGAGGWAYAGGQTAAVAASGSGALIGAGMTTFLYTVSAALVIGGISSIVAGNPTSPDFQSNERPENKPSYLFSGAVNTTQQGNPVPIGYGRLRVGSQVISAGIRSLEIPVT